MRSCQEEIFGPVLPVLEVERIEEAIDFVNSRPQALALYCFTCFKAGDEAGAEKYLFRRGLYQ